MKVLLIVWAFMMTCIPAWPADWKYVGRFSPPSGKSSELWFDQDSLRRSGTIVDVTYKFDNDRMASSRANGQIFKFNQIIARVQFDCQQRMIKIYYQDLLLDNIVQTRDRASPENQKFIDIPAGAGQSIILVAVCGR